MYLTEYKLYFNLLIITKIKNNKKAKKLHFIRNYRKNHLENCGSS